MDKQQKLNEIAKDLIATDGGPLKAPGVNAVPGEGDPDAKVMFIGEAPGFNENEQRRPFVGQAGKLLRKNLALNGLPENKVYITNIVKYRPPENRDPTPAEIEFFKTFLDRQIEVICPEIIVTLGRFSMYKFFGEGVSISKIHGVPRKINYLGQDILIFPMYHPAAALRAGDMLRSFEQDFVKLSRLIRGEKEEKIGADVKSPEVKLQDSTKQLELI